MLVNYLRYPPIVDDGFLFLLKPTDLKAWHNQFILKGSKLHLEFWRQLRKWDQKNWLIFFLWRDEFEILIPK